MVFLLLLNLISVVACNYLAKTRGSRHVVFWTSLGLGLGPLAIPILWFFVRDTGKTI